MGRDPKPVAAGLSPMRFVFPDEGDFGSERDFFVFAVAGEGAGEGYAWTGAAELSTTALPFAFPVCPCRLEGDSILAFCAPAALSFFAFFFFAALLAAPPLADKLMAAIRTDNRP